MKYVGSVGDHYETMLATDRKGGASTSTGFQCYVLVYSPVNGLSVKNPFPEVMEANHKIAEACKETVIQELP